MEGFGTKISNFRRDVYDGTLMANVKMGSVSDGGVLFRVKDN